MQISVIVLVFTDLVSLGVAMQDTLMPLFIRGSRP